jgi:hypothetical protein
MASLLTVAEFAQAAFLFFRAADLRCFWLSDFRRGAQWVMLFRRPG